MLFDHAFIGLGIGIGGLSALARLAARTPRGRCSTLSAICALNAADERHRAHLRIKGYANTAFNSQWLALVAAGEGLHNNHHAAPTSAKLALHRREIDPAWWVIFGSWSRLGQANIRLSSVRLASDVLGDPAKAIGS